MISLHSTVCSKQFDNNDLDFSLRKQKTAFQISKHMNLLRHQSQRALPSIHRAIPAELSTNSCCILDNRPIFSRYDRVFLKNHPVDAREALYKHRLVDARGVCSAMLDGVSGVIGLFWICNFWVAWFCQKVHILKWYSAAI